MENWQRLGRPGAIGSRKKEILANYDNLYGKNNWQLVWDVNGNSVNMDGALALYEDAYFEHFKKNPDELKWIADNFSNVYDNHTSNVNSGFNYNIQEYGGNHFQDIAIRKCLIRNGLWFNGEGLLEIRMKAPGKKWSPGSIKFHKPELIPQPEIQGSWWNPGSVESWYQSSKFLEVKNFNPEVNADLYFVTSNSGKVNSARRSLKNLSIAQIGLDISENQDNIKDISEHKAKVAYSTLCRPVICDDSGLVIPSLKGWPGVKVGRELDRMGEDKFAELFKDNPRDAYFVMAVTYNDATLSKPKTFISKVEGKLIYESKGDVNKPFVKNKILAGRFIPNGQTKTIAELTEEEYKRDATTDRWNELNDFLINKNRK